MRFLLGPLGTDGGGTARELDELITLAGVAEQWGFDGLLVTEGRLPDDDGWAAPFTVLMRAALRTTALRLGALCTPEITKPIYHAEEAAVLDAISSGRAFTVLRRASAEELSRLAGVSPAEGRYAEAVEVLLRSWAPPTFRFDGRHWRVPGRNERNTFAAGVDKVSVTPKPVQLVLPTWLLSTADGDDRKLARAFDLPVALDAGFAPSHGEGSFARPTLAIRDLHLDPDASRARDQAAPVLRDRHGDAASAQSWPDHAVVGDVDAVIDQLRGLAAGGVGLVACRPLWPTRGIEETATMLRFFGTAVVGEFRMDAFPEEIRIREPQGSGR